ncbi:MAG: ADP-ribosylglycohydrolase family protein [Methanobrevibacter sp.]|nr:ADP-ribosylglycohydrolase family protein [Methanobrevibacter sp.]
MVVADALGVPYEFSSRGFCNENPMTDMIGFGTYNQRPGTWSDDSPWL